MSAVGDAVHVLPGDQRAQARASERPTSPGCCSRDRRRSFADIPRSTTSCCSTGRRACRRSSTFGGSSRPRRFDLVINLQVYFKAGVVTSFTRAPVKLGFDRARARDMNWLFTNRKIPPHLEGQHVQDQYFEFLDGARRPVRAGDLESGPWPQERAWQEEFFEPIAQAGGIHCGRDQQTAEGLAAGAMGRSRRPTRRGVRPAAGAGRRPLAARAARGIGDHGARPAQTGIGVRQRASQSRRDSRRFRARARPGHRTTSHGGRARASGRSVSSGTRTPSARARTVGTTISSSTRTATRARTTRCRWKRDSIACHASRCRT